MQWDKGTLAQRFAQIFTQKTSFATLNQLLTRIHSNKAELLKVLERPDIHLHTNGSETDIRDYVKKEKSVVVHAVMKVNLVETRSSV